MRTRTYRALLVANSTFSADPSNLPDLEGPRNDPVILREALCHREAGLFPADNVRLVTERRMAEVLGELEDFLQSATRQDTLLLYYSGHGVLDQSGELFLCTRDTRTDRLRSTAVKASDLRAMMDESAAAATVVVVDCCHSGRFKGGDVPAGLSGRGRFVLTSTRSAELAHDAHVRNRASLFTHHLAEGLVAGADDRDGDGLVTLSELYDYVHAALAGEGRQVPQKRFEGDGEVAVASRPARRPAAADPAVVDPASAPPLLDVSEAAIDLGEIAADEALPPERIAVVNRGGGTLEWTVDTSADWLTAVADDGAVVLLLSPVAGPNRANVHVRDTATGALRTIRVTVRVRPAVGPKPRPRPPRVRLPEPALQFAAIAACAAVGLIFFMSGSGVHSSYGDLQDRGEDWGAGVLPTMAGGSALLVVALLALARPLRVPALGTCVGLALPLSFVRLGEAAAYGRLTSGVWLGESWLTGLVAAGLAGLYLVQSDQRRSAGWVPPALAVWSVIVGLLWAGSLVIDPYNQTAFGGSHYGGALTNDYFTVDTTYAFGLLVAAALVVGTLHVGMRRLSLAAGGGVVLGAATLPVLVVVNEVNYLVAGPEDPDDARRLMFMITPATLLVVLVLASLVVGRQSTHEPGPMSGSWAFQLGATFAATGRLVRRRAVWALIASAATVAFVGAGVAVLPDALSGVQLVTLPVRQGVIGPTAWNAAGQLLATNQRLDYVWDGETWDQIELPIAPLQVRSRVFSPRWNLVAEAGPDGLRLLNDEMVELRSLSTEDESVTQVEFAPRGDLLAAVNGGEVRVWNTTSRDVLSSLPSFDDGVHELAFSPVVDMLAVLDGQGSFSLWDSATGDPRLPTPGEATGFGEDGGEALAFSASGARLATGGTGRSAIVLWSPGTGVKVDEFGASEDEVEALAFSPDDGVLAAGAGDDVVLFDPTTGEKVTTLTGHDRAVTSLAFSPDGRWLASASDDSVRVWDVGEWVVSGDGARA